MGFRVHPALLWDRELLEVSTLGKVSVLFSQMIPQSLALPCTTCPPKNPAAFLTWCPAPTFPYFAPSLSFSTPIQNKTKGICSFLL